jgi:predicted signal transduction protein with EAL and GGDEF domain
MVIVRLTDSETLIKNADIALYQAKERGRGSIQFFNPEITEEGFDYLILESELHKRGSLKRFYPKLLLCADANKEDLSPISGV